MCQRPLAQKTLSDQIGAVNKAQPEMGEATPKKIARRFQHARVTSAQPLDSLAALGQAANNKDGRYFA